MTETTDFDEYRGLFSRFDRSGAGYIDSETLTKIFKSLGYCPREKEIEDIFNCANENNKIDFERFLELITKFKSDCNEENNMRKCFEIMSGGNVTGITHSELQRFLFNLGEKMADEEIDRLIAEGDLQGNGFITFEDFAKIARF